jgi:hypothetical protein
MRFCLQWQTESTTAAVRRKPKPPLYEETSRKIEYPLTTVELHLWTGAEREAKRHEDRSTGRHAGTAGVGTENGLTVEQRSMPHYGTSG